MRAMVLGAGRMGRAAAWDPKAGHGAMARTTSYPAAVVACMLGTGAIQERGVLPGELAVPFGPFVSAVRARGIEVAEQWESLN